MSKGKAHREVACSVLFWGRAVHICSPIQKKARGGAIIGLVESGWMEGRAGGHGGERGIPAQVKSRGAGQDRFLALAFSGG